MNRRCLLVVVLFVVEFSAIFVGGGNGKGKEKQDEKLGPVEESKSRKAVSQQVKSKKVSCTRENINEMAKAVRCKPRLTVVELLAGTKNRLVPNAVLAKRCAGSCDGFQRCLPTKSLNTTFFVKEYVKDKTYCSAIPITEDVDCLCACEVKLKDCTPYQQYSPETCSCRCINQEDFRRCITTTNKNMKWNERKCSCECLGSKNCSAGTVWDVSKCRCIKQ